MTDSNRGSSDGGNGSSHGENGSSDYGDNNNARAKKNCCSKEKNMAIGGTNDSGAVGSNLNGGAKLDATNVVDTGVGGAKDDDQTGTSELVCTSSISSTAAVVRGEGSWDRQHGHADVVIKKNHAHSKSHGSGGSKKRKRQELTSLEKDFKLDYEEVFLTSNVPQLIATPAGRIIAWNNFFLKATGLTKTEASRLTIFSIVQADKLSNLFEMIAQALRSSNATRISTSAATNETASGTTSSTVGTDQEEHSNGTSANSINKVENYPTLSLPCIDFPGFYRERHSVGSDGDSSSQPPKSPPLYMTVTLMHDEDPRKRCFHGILTDCPGTEGNIGSITPDLLSLLFQGLHNDGGWGKARETATVTALMDADGSESTGIALEPIKETQWKDLEQEAIHTNTVDISPYEDKVAKDDANASSFASSTQL
mmetsp:Transcript_55/g.84  ORF Transcript_55/g.84 Transcript_55/m.84 type:complete len:424 (+) Transcript_55:3-1274(+)